jgi:hypothetical protein
MSQRLLNEYQAAFRFVFRKGGPATLVIHLLDHGESEHTALDVWALIHVQMQP